jgi:chain length determinant protein tyrosine kinase EpsG
MKAYPRVLPSRDYYPDAPHGAPASGRAIGELLARARGLSDGHIEQILAYQRQTGLRFGEAAVKLRLADRDDVLHALSEQFSYATGFAGHPASSELIAAADPFSDQADAFRELRSRLMLEVLREPQRCALTIVSPDVGDGKTYLAANLAVAFSQLGEPTLLIDADLRTPRQHQLLGVAPNGGLSGVLAGFSESDMAVHPVPGLQHLYLLPAGALPPNPVELLHRPAFGALLRQMLHRFEHIVVDTAAATRGADSRVAAAQCGAALVVARRRHSRMVPLEGLVAALSRGPATLAGVVINEH